MMPFAATQIVIVSEVRHRKPNIISLLCGILKNDTNEVIDKTEVES